MNKKMYLSLLVVGAVLGIMLALQIRSTVGGVPMDRPQALTQELTQLETNYQKLLAEAVDLESSLDKIGQGTDKSFEALQNELKKVRFAAGLEPVTGAGVEIILDNMPEGKRQGVDPGLFTIKYEDLLRVVNELRAADARAIAINGQRLVSTSEIRSAGRFIDVNLVRLSPPYNIVAVGDPEKLESSLKIKGGLVETLREWSIAVTVTKQEELTVPAYTGPLEFNHAKPMTKEGDSK